MTGYDMLGINPLGTAGLGVSGSYSDPMSMMGISPYSSMGSMGMMGMMNPAFMGQMAEMQKQMLNIQNDMEKNKLNHAVDMHGLIQQAEVNNLEAHERALFEKAMADGDIKHGIRLLADVIRSGDQDAIVEQYDKLKSTIHTKYSDYFVQNNGKMNSFENVNNLISTLYAQILTAQNGGVPIDLRDDIKRYGETAFNHGFNQTFLGNKGHNDRYTEETLSYLYGTRINDKGSKDRAEKWGGYAARGAEGMAALAAGYGAGITAKALLNFITPSFIQKGANKAGNWLSGTSKVGKGTVNALKYVNGWGRWGKLGALGLLAADIMWQMSRD